MLPANLIRNDYEQLEQIGDGNYGVVYRARHLPTGQIRAIKKMNRKKFVILI